MPHVLLEKYLKLTHELNELVLPDALDQLDQILDARDAIINDLKAFDAIEEGDDDIIDAIRLEDKLFHDSLEKILHITGQAIEDTKFERVQHGKNKLAMKKLSQSGPSSQSVYFDHKK